MSLSALHCSSSTTRESGPGQSGGAGPGGSGGTVSSGGTGGVVQSGGTGGVVAEGGTGGGAPPPPPGDLCAMTEAHAVECGVTEPMGECDSTDPVQACTAGCMIEAPCPELVGLIEGTLSPDGPLFACVLDCATGTVPPDGPCAAAETTFTECGVSEPLGACDVSSALDACTFQCLADAPCDELTEFMSGGFPVGLGACVSACVESVPQYDCGDGDTIPTDWVCDGTEDCSNGADEATC